MNCRAGRRNYGKRLTVSVGTRQRMLAAFLRSEDYTLPNGLDEQ
jgi:hypothetical protein